MAPRVRRSRPRRRPLRRRPARGGMKGKQRRAQGAPSRQLIQANLGGLSLTRFTASRKPSAVAAHIKRVGAPNFLNVTYPGVAQSLGGTQAYSSWYLNCLNDLQRIWASIQGKFITPNTATGVTVPTNAPGNINTPTQNASFRFVLESAVSLLHMANTSGTPLNLEIYDVVAKRDIGQVAYDISGNRIKGLSTGLGFMDPSIAWYLGMTDQASLPTGFPPSTIAISSDPSNLGSTPYNSKMFKDYFKVVRKSNVSLPIGGQHKHYVDLKPNFVVDQDLMTQNAVFKGQSYFTLVVAQGVPVVACPATGPLGGDVTTSSVSLSLIQNVKYKWTWVEDARENVYRVNYINPEVVNAQSIQPAMNKVNHAETFSLQQATYDGIDGVFSSLPSECTR